MILATYYAADGAYRLAAVQRESAKLVDLQAAYERLNGRQSKDLLSMQSLIEGGEAALDRAREVEQAMATESTVLLDLNSVRLAAPLPCPPQMRDFSSFETHMRQAAVGMARLRSARQGSNGPLPKPSDIVMPEAFIQQPVYYKTNRFSVVGHEHDVHWPVGCEYFDYEVEFGIVIGRDGRDITAAQAASYIFGYTIFNDFSARDIQEFEMTTPFGPTKGKDFDTGNVLGPWIVTADEIPDPYQLQLSARVNGEQWSSGNSRDMLHSFEDMLVHVSRNETLHAGEFFGSGTVGGGCGLELNRWIQPGDIVELEVEGIGVLRNRVVRK